MATVESALRVPRGPFAWYFYLSGSLPLRLILFAWLTFAFLYTAFCAALRTLAVLKVSWAVPAAVNTLFALVVLWFITLPFLVPLQLTPLFAYAVQFVGLPGVWQGEMTKLQKTGITVALLVGGYVAALILSWIGLTLIGWIADLNPCASWRAGVTGSVPPAPRSCN